MTREEAITKYIVPAIEKTWNDKRCKEILEALEQEPCEYVVDQEKVNDILGHCIHNQEDYYLAIKMLNELPPVKSQEPKTGHWIKVTNGRGGHECDICHEYAPSYQSGDEYLTKYCPNCGARMVEPQESEVQDADND